MLCGKRFDGRLRDSPGSPSVRPMSSLGLSQLDYAALAWLLFCWGGYSLVADYGPWRDRSVSAVMGRYRTRWMTVMLGRENRIVDSNIIGNLLNGVAFFSSTTIFAIGGLLAALGATDSAVALLRDLPFAAETSSSELELKVLLLVAILTFSFFKFAWAYRLFNNCSVLIGAAPIEAADDPGAAPIDAADAPGAARLADGAARLNILAARHFNRGLRAYFFALAALAWLVHPLLLMATSAWVVFVIYRREFRSRSLGILLEKD